VPSPHIKQLPPTAVQANQGSALKYQNVTHMVNLYDEAPSGQPSKAVMNLFVCAPRKLLPSLDEDTLRGFFPIDILERHPFTTQTFMPLGISPLDQASTQYLVIVAPSCPPSPEVEHLPVPTTTIVGPDWHLPGRGLPDLSEIRAFIATGSQAVTYGAGTWHAPMVAIGRRPIDFVVVQFANGVEVEDCQETIISSESLPQLKVAVPEVGNLASSPTPKL